LSRKAIAELLEHLTKAEAFEKLAVKCGLDPGFAALKISELAETIRKKSTASINKAVVLQESLPIQHRHSQKIKIFIDGASRGNPGPSAAAAIFYNSSGKFLKQISKFLGNATNNMAEYAGLLIALDLALQLNVRQIEIHSDSDILIKQMKGVYKIKSPNLKHLYLQAKEKAQKFDIVTFKHIPREMNHAADALCNNLLDKTIE